MKLLNCVAAATLPAACLALLLHAGPAHAQSTGACPVLPEDTGLAWEALDGPGFTFCRALRGDGSEAFAVMLGSKSPFKPSRGNRAETATINGQQLSWYRGELVNRPGAQARETLVELGRGRIAHISLSADNDGQLADAFRQVEQMRFEANQLSSN